MDPTNTEIAGQRHTDDEFLETEHIAIEGMTCDKCVQTVERALRGKRGVKHVEVDPQTAIATVIFDNRQTHVPDLHDALLKSGYRPKARAT